MIHIVIASTIAFFTPAHPAPAEVPIPIVQNTIPAVPAPLPASTSAAREPADVNTKAAPIMRTRVSPTSNKDAQPTSTTHAVNQNEAVRVQDPYNTAPESFDAINASVRSALVNILCMSRSGGSLRPTSGSGVFIDPRGVILTNAHVAQYVLLSESPRIDLSCVIRSGSPARDIGQAKVLYLPSVWAEEHVSELNKQSVMGTGEHDYALLLMETPGAVPGGFPSLSFDTREAIGFPGDQVLVASYPAEFIGGTEAETSLYADTSITPIGKLYTFTSDSADVFSVGSVIEAQSGSSGGAVVNAWDRLIGIVTTTSGGKTTGDRDLHAVSLSYIDRDLAGQTGQHLSDFLSGDLQTKEANFESSSLPSLLSLYIAQLGGSN